MALRINESNANFGLHFYQKVSKAKPCENLLLSPINLEAALSLLFYGARGSTAHEIEKVSIIKL